jgi:prepilin-type N-terminal cleavage/methylation domain-containing protein
MTIPWFSQWSKRNLHCRWGGESGLTLAELLVVVAILSIMGLLTIPHLNSSVYTLSGTADELVANIRLARGYATGRGAHYRVTINTGSYTVQRLVDLDGDGLWDPDSRFPPQTVGLPAAVRIVTGAVLEFNTRGLLSPLPPAPLLIQLRDSNTGKSKQVTIWASGQIYEV